MKKMIRTEQRAAGITHVKSESGAEAPKVPRAKPVFNSEGNMVFSKFDFSEIGTKKKPPKSEKDPKKALQIIQQKKEKLKALEEAGEKEKAQEMKEKDAWKAVLAKAGGEKVSIQINISFYPVSFTFLFLTSRLPFPIFQIKDDPDLLKRTIKRTHQQKTKSAKKWESRIEGVEKAKQDRQHTRQENIDKRKKDKKTNKLKKASKKGRVIPGY